MHVGEAAVLSMCCTEEHVHPHGEAPLSLLLQEADGGLYETVTEVSYGKEGKTLPRGLLQERHFLLGGGERDEVVLKRCSGLHQNTLHSEFEWRLVMSPSGEGSRIQAQLLRP